MDLKKIALPAAAVAGMMAIPGGIVAGPLLNLLGFGSLGPIAGSLAAGYQSVFGVNVIFSLLQSAAMAGYGAALVAGTVKVAVIGGVGYIIRLIK